MRLCTAEQMRAIDRHTIQTIGLPGMVLMESAGRALSDHLCAAIGRTPGALSGLNVAVLCGSGNNGGDGLVVARYLHTWGAAVDVYIVGDTEGFTPDTRANFGILKRSGVTPRQIATRESEEQRGSIEHADLAMTQADVIVDALLGSGFRGQLRQPYRTLVQAANKASAFKVAADIPTGMCADSGRSDSVVFSADLSVTFAYAKIGMVNSPGVRHVGQVKVVDIGIPRVVTRGSRFAGRLIDTPYVRKLLRRRPQGGHKGTFGHVMIFGGAPGKTGALALAGQASLRSGAGRVTLAPPADSLATMEAKAHECMVARILPNLAKLDDSETLFSELSDYLSKKTALAVGPGLSFPDATIGVGIKRFVARLIQQSPCPLVIDADALNALAGNLDCLTQADVPLILTPHPGEMSRLIARPVAEIQNDRLTVARSFARRHGVYLVLKGERSIAATPNGRVFISPAGNSGMGSAGMGDTLTGIIASLLGQGYEAEHALVIGTYLHGAAGDRAAEHSGAHGLIARDLIAAIGPTLARWSV